MRRLRRHDGFTLLELLAVLVILIIFAGLSIPHMRLPQNLDGAARQISGLIQALHDKSRATKLLYRLHFNINTDQYWVTSVKGVVEIPLTDPLFHDLSSLPHDVHFHDVVVSHRSHQSDSDTFMQFFPVGRVEPTIIYLKNQADVLSLLVHPVMGSVRTVEGQYIPRRWKDVAM